MNIKYPEKRLEKFWGKVDHKHIQIIKKFLQGKTILDIGCGYGTTTAALNKEGYSCQGIDTDKESINIAKHKFPHCNFQIANAEHLPFESEQFDVIILRDALHHLYKEANFDKVKMELMRVAKKKSRIIFFDPNINLIVRTARKISFHQDVECDFETAKKIMKEELNYTITAYEFNTLISLPLSGGYVGINFVPNISFIHQFIFFIEKLIEKTVNKTGLGRYICWRYIIVGERS